MSKTIESDTVIVTTDGRARLDVKRLFEKPDVKKSLRRMKETIRIVSHGTDAYLAKDQPLPKK